jgi:hypothetical protein
MLERIGGVRHRLYIGWVELGHTDRGVSAIVNKDGEENSWVLLAYV